MEAPEKLYLSKNIYSTFLYQVPDPDDNTTIEYISKDAFIEKVKSFLNMKDDRDYYTIGKAEQRALEAYPPKYVEQERHSKRVQSEKVDTHQPMRVIYIKGYQQAEKDLALTWEDIADILDVTDVIANDDSMEERLKTMSEEEYYQEILKRFKERKK